MRRSLQLALVLGFVLHLLTHPLVHACSSFPQALGAPEWQQDAADVSSGYAGQHCAVCGNVAAAAVRFSEFNWRPAEHFISADLRAIHPNSECVDTASLRGPPMIG